MIFTRIKANMDWSVFEKKRLNALQWAFLILA